jgi:hypothetical protein
MGAERAEKRCLRWGISFQAHHGVGFVIDDEGKDVYGGNIVGLGFSWHVGVAATFLSRSTSEAKMLTVANRWTILTRSVVRRPASSLTAKRICRPVRAEALDYTHAA